MPEDLQPALWGPESLRTINFFFADPFVEMYFDQLEAAEAQQFNSMRAALSVEDARRVVEAARMYPTASKELVTAVGVSGTDPSDPAVAELVQRDFEQKNDGLWDRFFGGVKGVVRGGFTVFDAMWEELFSRPFRTLVAYGSQGPTPNELREIEARYGLAQGSLGSKLDLGNSYEIEAYMRARNDGMEFSQVGMSLPETYRRAGTSYGMRAIGAMMSGDPVNLGSGFMPESTEVEDFDLYGELTSMGWSPEAASQQVLAAKGQPITRLAREQAESLTYRGLAISPGRFLAGHLPVEPGTIPYNVLSGITDAAAQIWLDPSNAMLLGMGKARKLNRMFGYEWATPAQALLHPGRMPRASVFRPTARQVFTSARGRKLVDAIAGTDNLAELIGMFGRRHRLMPRDVYRQMAQMTDPDDIRDLLIGAVEFGLMRDIPIPRSLTGSMLERAGITQGGTISSAIGGAMGGTMGQLGGFRAGFRAVLDRHGWGRLFRTMPEELLSIDNLDAGFYTLDEFLISAGMSSDRRSVYLNSWAELTDEATADEAWNVLRPALAEIEERIAKDFEGIPGMTKTMAREMAQKVTDAFGQLDELRKYDISEAGQATFHPGARLYAWRKGRKGTVTPSAHLTSEMLQRAIPLPDARGLRKAQGKIRKLALTVNGATGERLIDMLRKDPLGENMLNRLADPFMQKWWKPFTLLRIAWPVRVLGEEQLRSAAAGYASMFSHPLQYMGWLTYDPDGGLMHKVLRAIKAPVKDRGTMGVLGDPALAGRYSDRDIFLALSDEHAAAMTAGTKPFIGAYGSKTRRVNFRTYNRNHHVYHRVWAGELRQLWMDEVAPIVARDGKEKAYQWLVSEAGEETRRRLAKSGIGFSDIATSDDMARLYIDSVWARLQIKTGGSVRLRFDLDGNGQWVDVNPAEVPKEFMELFDPDGPKDWAAIRRRIQYQPTEQVGNEQLLNMIGTGQWTTKMGDKIEIIDLRKVEGSSKTMDAFVKELRTTYDEMGPDWVKGPFDADNWNKRWKGRGANKPSKGDQPTTFVEHMFETLMAKPTDTLSRSPMFSQVYWRRAAELIGFASAPVQDAILRAAKEANIPRRDLRRMARDAMKSRGRRAIDTVTAERAAKIRRVRELGNDELVGMVRKSRVYDMLRNPDELDEFLVTIRNADESIDDAFLALSEMWRRLPERYDARLVDWAMTHGGVQPSQILGEFDAWDILDEGAIEALRNTNDLDELLQTLDDLVLEGSYVPDAGRSGLDYLPEMYRPLAEMFGFEDFKALLTSDDPDQLADLMGAWDDLVANITPAQIDAIEQARDARILSIADALLPRPVRSHGLSANDLREMGLLGGVDPNTGLTGLVDNLGPGAPSSRIRRFRDPQELLDFANRKGFSREELGEWLLRDDVSASDRMGRFLEHRRRARQGTGQPVGGDMVRGGTSPAGPPSGARPGQRPPGRPGPATRPGGIGAPTPSAYLVEDLLRRGSRLYQAFDDPRVAQYLDEMEEYLKLADEGRHINEIDDLRDIDRLAKGFALDEVKRLLYDTTRKHQFMDAYRNIFPFGEAWVEIIGTWARLMYENPNIWRRAQQGIEGARDSGFFTVDESTGEEMFNYPAAGVLAGLFSKVADIRGTGELLAGAGLSELMTEEDSSALIFQGRLQGLNLVAGQWLPGFGPVLQIPASHLLEASTFDGLIEALLPWSGIDVRDKLSEVVTPFGEQKISGDLPLKMLPVWLRRVASAYGIQDENMARLKANTTIDVMKALVLQGAPVNTLEDSQRLVQRATRIADQLTLIRGIAQMFSPTGPEVKFYTQANMSPEEFAEILRGNLQGFTTSQRDAVLEAVSAASTPEEAEEVALSMGVDMKPIRDSFGKMWLYQSLAGIYREELFGRFNGDDTAAFNWFYRTYGLDPTLFATPKTVQVERRHTTFEGDQWSRDNRHLFEAAPLTAYYANPDSEDDPFDYPAYLRQLETEARMSLKPGQWLWRRNDTLGRILYEKAKAEADEKYGPWNSRIKVESLRLTRYMIADRLPGYMQPIPGAPQRPSLESKIIELEQQWPNHEQLGGSQAGEGVRRYLQMRAEAARRSLARGYNPESWATAKGNADLRAAVKQYAQRLVNRYPDFQYVYTLVLQHEMTEDDSPATLGTSESRLSVVSVDDVLGVGGEL